MSLGRWLSKALSYDGLRVFGPLKRPLSTLISGPATRSFSSPLALSFSNLRCRIKSSVATLDMARALKQGEFVGSLDCGTT